MIQYNNNSLTVTRKSLKDECAESFNLDKFKSTTQGAFVPADGYLVRFPQDTHHIFVIRLPTGPEIVFAFFISEETKQPALEELKRFAPMYRDNNISDGVKLIAVKPIPGPLPGEYPYFEVLAFKVFDKLVELAN